MELLIGLILATVGAFLPGWSAKQKGAFLAVVAIVAGGVWWIRRPGVEVTIAYPINGGEVAMREQVRGESHNLSESDRLWLVVYPHGVDRYYPEAFPPSRNGGEWSLATHIGVVGDEGRRFDLVAVVVDDAAVSTLADYVQAGQTTGSWNGLATLPAGFDELARITVIRLGDDVAPPAMTKQEQAVAAATGFVDAWVAGDYDLMCTFREPCTEDWPHFMRAAPIPVRDYELGEVTQTAEGYRLAYDIQLPDHGSLAGAFMETPDAAEWISLLGLTGEYVTWEDTLAVKAVEDSFRVVPSTAQDGNASSSISFFQWFLGSFDAIGFPTADDSGERLLHYWATYQTVFDLTKEEVDLLISEGLDQYDAYLARLDTFAELADLAGAGS